MRDTQTLLIEKNRTTTLPEGNQIIYPGTDERGNFQGGPTDADAQPSYLPVKWLNLINRMLGRLVMAAGTEPSPEREEQLATAIQSLIDKAAKEVKAEAQRDSSSKDDSLENKLKVRIGQARNEAKTADSSLENKLKALIQKAKVDAFKEAYPVGSVYVNAQSSSNPSSLGLPGSWSALPANYFLGIAGNRYAVGGTYAEGLPNITGAVGLTRHFSPSASDGTVRRMNDYNQDPSGPFYNNTYGYGVNWFDSDDINYRDDSFSISFNASRSNAIYGKANYVRPQAYGVSAWRRVA